MTRDDAKWSLIAAVSGVLMGCLLIGLELIGIDWAGLYRKWFALVVWTICVFGSVAFAYGAHLKRVKVLVLFLAMVGIHVSGLALYLRSVDRFPTVSFLALLPVEVGLVALVMTVLAGVDPRRVHRERRSHKQRRPPERQDRS